MVLAPFAELRDQALQGSAPLNVESYGLVKSTRDRFASCIERYVCSVSFDLVTKRLERQFRSLRRRLLASYTVAWRAVGT
jgi:hypothetical protein